MYKRIKYYEIKKEFNENAVDSKNKGHNQLTKDKLQKIYPTNWWD